MREYYMNKIVECIPNFSEGRDPKVIDKIIAQIQAVPGVFLLDKEMDADHNRSVVTFVGSPDGVLEAAFKAIAQAKDMIDLNKHQGAHPRMGATDVCPFVPVQGVTMEECVELAHKLAKRVGEELQIPVFLYEDAAQREDRKNLAAIRKGEFEMLKEWIGTDPEKTPDYGPNAIHPTAGAIAIGARFFLIAYNVNLNSSEVKIAKRIAKSIRERDGGFPCVKALGLALPEKNMIQVSMNLTDYRKTSMKTVFDEITKQANEQGVEVVESEIIGVIPQNALESTLKETLKIRDFSSQQIIENCFMARQQDPLTSPEAFVQATCSGTPTPGGGSVSALAGSLAAALGRMVYEITKKSKKYSHQAPELEPVERKLHCLQDLLFLDVQEDSKAYESFMEARKLPKTTDEEVAERNKAIEDATMKSILVPMEVMSSSLAILHTLPTLKEKGTPNAISDVGVSCLMAHAALEGAMLNVLINIPSLQDIEVKNNILDRCLKMQAEAKDLKETIMLKIHELL